MLLDCGADEQPHSTPPRIKEGAIETLRGQLSVLSQAKSEHDMRNRGGEECVPSICPSSDSFFWDDDSMFSALNASHSTPSSSTTASVGSSFDFLRTVFPTSSPTLLRRVLEENIPRKGEDDEELDMGNVIHEVLSWEAIRDMEERGIDDVPFTKCDEPPVNTEWTEGGNKKTRARKGKKAMTIALGDDLEDLQLQPGTKIHLFDIRQRYQKPLVGSSESAASVAGPWTTLTSLASRLSELLSPLPQSHFLSLFHNPKFSSPSKGLRHELQLLATLRTSKGADTSADESLASLVSVLALEDAGANELEDARICLKAVKQDIGMAMDLFNLLHELERSIPVVSHSLVPVSTTSKGRRIAHTSPPSPVGTFPRSPPLSTLAERPPSQLKPPTSWAKVTSLPRVRARDAKPKVEMAEDPLGQFIPAYRGLPIGWRAESGRSATEPDLNEGDTLSPDECRYWANYYRSKREESLAQASKYWRGGSSTNRGGDVAMHFAEESREYDRKSRDWAMKAARQLVKSRQYTAHNRHTIDLHGLTVHESLTLVDEALNEWWNSAGSRSIPTYPLTIITGVGNHSKKKVGVIGPAVLNALDREGWRTSKRPGVVVVTGRRHG
ncbi:hypothetical protein FRB99_006817 [Tulasnella sp. 403]|nr:hypothetical protein FRB99_006817 [Tulasnella sp. 403]